MYNTENMKSDIDIDTVIGICVGGCVIAILLATILISLLASGLKLYFGGSSKTRDTGGIIVYVIVTL